MRAKRRGRAVIAALAVALLLGACGGGGTPPRPEPSASAGRPTVSIVAPVDGQIVGGGSVTVRVEVKSFRSVDKLNQPPVAGEGHIHFYRDQTQIPSTKGQPAVTAKGTYHATGELSHTWTNLAPGAHSLAVQLVNNDHTPLDPPVVDAVSITVR